MSVDPPPQLDEAPLSPQQPPRGALRTIFLIVLCDLLGFSVIIPLLPFWARKYHASDFEVGLLFSVYSICQLVGSPILGLISDRFGRRPVLIASQIGSVLGFILLGIATHGNWASPGLGLLLVYVSRVIDGLSGGNISTAQAYISDVTTEETRTKGMGMLGAAFGIGFTIGPAIGGVLGHFDPSWPAFAAALCSAVACFQTWRFLQESRFHKESEEAEAWLHPSRFLPIIRNHPLLQMLLIFFFSMMAFVMMESTFAIYLNDKLSFDELHVGLLFALAGTMIAIVQGGLVGRLSRKVGEWPLVIVGPLFVTAAMLMLAQINVHPLVWLVVVATITNATGRSLQTPALSSLISHTADRNLQGTTFGLFHMLGSLARVVGPIIATGVYTHHHAGPYLIAGSITAAMAAWSIYLRAAAPTRGADRAVSVATSG